MSQDSVVLATLYEKLEGMDLNKLKKLRTMFANEIVRRELKIKSLTDEEVKIAYLTIKTLLKRGEKDER